MLSALSFNTTDAFKGCESPQMNDLCLTKVVDRCYTCIYTENEVMYNHSPVCVPVFHNNLGVLDNYPSNNWNCTIYRHQQDSKTDDDMSDEDYEQYIESEFVDEINEKADENDVEDKVVTDICKIDDFIILLCQQENKNGFCMIANFIHDICNKHEYSNSNISSFNTYDFETLGCGKEKFKCMLKKNCRRLVKELDKCNEDISCILSLLLNPDISNITEFFDVVKCMIPSLQQSS